MGQSDLGPTLRNDDSERKLRDPASITANHSLGTSRIFFTSPRRILKINEEIRECP